MSILHRLTLEAFGLPYQPTEVYFGCSICHSSMTLKQDVCCDGYGRGAWIDAFSAEKTNLDPKRWPPPHIDVVDGYKE